MPEPSYDLILVGGGLANGLIALCLKRRRPELRVLLVEGGETLGGNHTWSFHDEDLTPEQHRWIAPLIAHRWQRYSVSFPGFTRQLHSGYASMTSTGFHDLLTGELGEAVRLGTRVAAVGPSWIRLEAGEEIGGRAVIDGRGPRPSRHMALGYQKFLGQEVRLTGPHGLDGPVIMDATVPQNDGYRFVYLLPFAPDRLLIEDTYYANGPAVDAAILRQRIAAYAKGRGWTIAAVLREETGVLPITLSGDVAAFWAEADGIPRSGLAAGLFHPTTGYSLPDAVRLAELVAGLPDLAAPALFAAISFYAHEQWQRRRFFRILNRMLFIGAHPERRYKVLRRFYTLPEPLIRRLYAARLTTWDKLRILTGKPPMSILAGIRAIATIPSPEEVA